MSRKPKRRISHFSKNDKCQPIYEEFVSGFIQEMESNKYGDKIISFNLLKQRKTVNKTNSEYKCSNTKTKNFDKKHPLMEKTQKSAKYLKHNRNKPKQRAHVSTFEETSNRPVKKKTTEEFAKCIKDAYLKSQKRSVKNQKLVNRNFSINSKKSGECITGASNELNDKNDQTSSDSEHNYEHFIRNHKVASNGGIAKTLKNQRKKKNKFKRIQFFSDSEPDTETPNKVQRNIVRKMDFNDPESSSDMKPKAVPEEKYSALNETFQNSYSDSTIRSNELEDSSSISKHVGCSATLVQNPFSNREELSDEILENNLKQDIFKNNLNLSGNIKHISSHVREIDEEHLMPQNNFENDLDFSDQDWLSDTFLENILTQGNSENNINQSHNTQYISSNNDGIDKCLILQNNSTKDFDILDHKVIPDTRLETILKQDNSKNKNIRTYNLQHRIPHNKETAGNSSNSSNYSDNTLSNPLNSVDSDGECFIFKSNFERDSVNKSILDDDVLRKDSNDEDCLILCEVPKIPRILSNIKNKDLSVNRSNLDGDLLRKDSNDEDCFILYEAPKFPQNLSDIKIEDNLLSRSNLDGNLLRKGTNNEEIDENYLNLCQILKFSPKLSDVKNKDESINRSNLDGNLVSKAANNEDIDAFCRILSEVNKLSQNLSDIKKDDSKNSNLGGNLLLEASNNEDIDEECLVLCEIPKFPSNSLDIKTMHKNSDNCYTEIYSYHADENDLKVNFPILSSKLANSTILAKTRLLNKNEPSCFVNIPHSVKNYVSDYMSSSKSELLEKSDFNSNHHPDLLKKDYFKQAKRYCYPIPDKKNKPNDNKS